MPVTSFSAEHEWWTELRQNGMLIAPALLDEVFPDGPESSDPHSYRRLRDHYNSFRAWLDGHEGELPSSAQPLHTWLDRVLQEFLGHQAERWDKGPNVPDRFAAESIHGQRLRADRVLYRDSGSEAEPALLVGIDRSKRVGIGRGRTAYGKFLELLRGCNQKLGLLTNGSQFRLCYAGLDHDAWVEWEAGDWFEQESLRPRLHGFYTLIGPPGLESRDGLEYPLLHAAEASRTRQSDLSAVLGEQVREAVEALLESVESAQRRHADFLDPLRRRPDGSEVSQRDALAALYQAACRIVMRMVVILFAEARGLLPRDIEAYNASYGLEGLFEQLQQAASHEGFQSLRERRAAWPRLLGLFNLIHDGSDHPDINVPAYGGLLFRPGGPDASDPVLRALSLFRDLRLQVTDATVLGILRLLKIGSVRVKRGRTSTWAKGPVDFSQLRTEYIGMMYEGLLDYRLVEAGEPTVFLNIGEQPILPLPMLEDMPDENLADLISELSGESSAAPDVETIDEMPEEAKEEPVAEEEEPIEEEEPEEEEEEEQLLTRDDRLHRRAMRWALRAVEVAGLVTRRSDEPDYYYDQRKEKRAHKLLDRVVSSGGFYLSRASAVRKGTGTFYTKPQLAVPTARRVLEPLLYEENDGKQTAREPREILSLKVCDPACGSGSFLVGALHQMTDALYRSVIRHGQIREHHQSAVITLPYGEESVGALQEETVPVPPDDDRFEDMLRSRLQRYVVERCIYGVDINPMAVELCRLSLWIETMDPQLPFGFLDHKIKVGNSLVGCWFDYFQDYPFMAWERDAGDSGYTNGVRFGEGEWSAAIKQTREDRVKPELRRLIREGGQQSWLFDMFEGETPEGLHEEALEVFEELHSLPVSAEGIEKRERLYREKIQNNPKLRELKDAFDLWCAVWFWPADQVGEEAPTPASFFDPSEETRDVAREMAANEHLRFFHWELEFPDVFARPGSGFDAVLGNPPWETLKPNSKEFFSRYDPIYRTRGKQEALEEQTRLFGSDPSIEREWMQENARYAALSNWIAHAANPWGYRERVPGEGGPRNLMNVGARWRTSDELHRQWKKQREGRPAYAGREHPFRHQGAADRNSYKMFLETAHALCADGGRFGLILPSGLYTDKGTTDLRELLLEECRWEWVFGFENRQGIFPIHRSYKFGPIVVEKGAETEAIRTAFMRHDVSDWEDAQDYAFEYPREQADRFSPNTRSLLEIQTRRDLEILEKIYDGAVLLGDDSEDGWGIEYAREFDMTNDSHLFVPRPEAEEDGYVPDIYGRWLKGGWEQVGDSPPPNTIRCRAAGEYVHSGKGIIPSRDGTRYIHEDDIEDTMLPLFQGVMIWHHNPHAAEYVSGAGHQTKWEATDRPSGPAVSQFLLPMEEYQANSKVHRGTKCVFRALSNATNERTFVSTVLDGPPCGNSLGILDKTDFRVVEAIVLSVFMNSLAYDFQMRCRIAGTNINSFFLWETPTAPLRCIKGRSSLTSGASLMFPNASHAATWLRLLLHGFPPEGTWTQCLGLTPTERVRHRAILDALTASLYGVSPADVDWMLRQDETDPKGFWRVDQDKPLDLRHTTLALAAFRDLKRMGLEEFLSIEDPAGLPGCGWQIPEKLAVSLGEDGIIEFDQPGVDPVPVRERLGPRFYDWQLEKSPEESWQECHLHARNILGETEYQDLLRELEGQGEEGGPSAARGPRNKPPDKKPPGPDAKGQGRLIDNDPENSLF
ncbi:MAG: Eco57I restriction-modification methylase domain-containing protein [Planctomycetota bacterium]